MDKNINNLETCIFYKLCIVTKILDGRNFLLKNIDIEEEWC